MGIRNHYGLAPLAPYLPTQDEIAAAAAAIQATWSEHERRKRFVGPKEVPVEMAVIEVACVRRNLIEDKRNRY